MQGCTGIGLLSNILRVGPFGVFFAENA